MNYRASKHTDQGYGWAAEQQALEDLGEKDRQDPLTSLPSRVDQQAANLITSYDDQVKAVLKSQTASIERKYQVDWEQSFYTSMICAGSCATEINAASHADRLSDFCAKVLPIGAAHMNAHMSMWNFLTKAREYAGST
ncbi:hypothetical protein LTR10_008657 [Elasticomyces elasticus]|nr:hypothetical protein LTR10_008657 [Elasticomyces elasticus]KAK4974369.1 hypothetical protein LTR42_005012 [Elasticomyces elasticus]